MRIYVAGPMRGIPQYNHPAFNAAVARLRGAGHEVFSPAEQDIAHGNDAAGSDGLSGFANSPGYLRMVMAEDLAWIMVHADAIVVLPGWEASKGAQAEVHAALAVAIPVCQLEDFLAGDSSGDVSWGQLHP